MMKKYVYVLFAFMMSTFNTIAKDKEVHLHWLHTSDVHGSLFGYDYLTKKPVDCGLASIYSYSLQLRKQYGDDLIMSDGGDCLQGQPTAYYYNYVDTVSSHLVAQCMNEMHYDVGAVGNHDIETGHSVYDRWMQECNYSFVGANIIDTRSEEPYLKPYIIIEREGVRIAVLGMLTPAIPSWLPENLWSGLRFEDMVESSRMWVSIIKEKEHPDIIVGLFHSGFDGGIVSADYVENATRAVAESVPGIDLILYGHDHHPLVSYIKNTCGDTCVCVAPASQGTVVAEADIVLQLMKGKVVSKHVTGKTTVMHGAQTPDALAFEAEFTDQRQTIERWIDQPIGSISKTIHERDAFFGSSEFIDLIHHMQLDITGADISFAAPLSFDSNVEEGTLRVSDMFAIYKYENFLYTMRLSGREIKGFLEMSYALWSNQMKSPDDHCLLLDSVLDNGRRKGLKNLSFNMDSAAGIIYTVDVTKPEGQRITIISMADGTPFDFDKYYRVAVNSYRGNGGGELLTRGAGIPHDSLAGRILWASDLDLRYYLMQRVKQQGNIVPKRLNNWKFVPEEWTIPALKRDRLILFPDGM